MPAWRNVDEGREDNDLTTRGPPMIGLHPVLPPGPALSPGGGRRGCTHSVQACFLHSTAIMRRSTLGLRQAARVGRVRSQGGWNPYRRALGIFPGNPEPQAGIDRLVAQHREQLAGIEKADEAARLLAVRHRNVTPAPDEDKIPTIRVGLAEGADALTFSVGGAFRLLDATGNEVLRGPALERWRVEHGDGDLHLFDEAGELRGGSTRLRSSRSLGTRAHPHLVRQDLWQWKANFYARIEHRQYRGEFEFWSARMV